MITDFTSARIRRAFLFSISLAAATTSGWSASAALAVPAWQRVRDSHPDNRYRLMLSLGRAS